MTASKLHSAYASPAEENWTMQPAKEMVLSLEMQFIRIFGL
jgi:hypothetical protein